ncbi:hypothetical protein MRB53_042264 [Persea americana]|nr:hypothetical protein MRB53_042264 [Persea americana]
MSQSTGLASATERLLHTTEPWGLATPRVRETADTVRSCRRARLIRHICKPQTPGIRTAKSIERHAPGGVRPGQVLRDWVHTATAPHRPCWPDQSPPPMRVPADQMKRWGRGEGGCAVREGHAVMRCCCMPLAAPHASPGGARAGVVGSRLESYLAESAAGTPHSTHPSTPPVICCTRLSPCRCFGAAGQSGRGRAAGQDADDGVRFGVSVFLGTQHADPRMGWAKGGWSVERGACGVCVGGQAGQAVTHGHGGQAVIHGHAGEAVMIHGHTAPRRPSPITRDRSQTRVEPQFAQGREGLFPAAPTWHARSPLPARMLRPLNPLASFGLLWPPLASFGRLCARAKHAFRHTTRAGSWPDPVSPPCCSWEAPRALPHSPWARRQWRCPELSS